MNRVTIFIPISRPEHLQRLFASLELLDCDPEKTNLLTYVDGDQQLYVKVRNMTEASRFSQRLCVHRKATHDPSQFALRNRRKRISNIKNESKELIGDCEYIFGIEDDTIIPPSTLKRLLAGYALRPYAGFIEGVELGRWGLPYVGAWRTDDVYEPTKIDSLMPGEGIEEIDAGGFYCYITKRETYMEHEYAPFGNNDLGPDVNYGLWLRQQGYKNYIDWSIRCEHYQRGGASISLATTEPQQVSLIKDGNDWQQKIA